MEYFNTKEAVLAGEALGAFFAAQASAELVAYLEKNEAILCNSTVQSLLNKTVELTAPLKLNLYKRLRFMGAFRAYLLRNEISDTTIEHLSKILIQGLSKNIIAKAQVRASSASAKKIKLPDTLTERMTSLKQLIDARNFEQAVSFLKSWISEEPNNAMLASNLGGALLELGRVEEGSKELYRAVSLKPNLAAPYINLGSLLLWQGELDKAEVVLRKAVQLEPKDLKGLTVLASALATKGALRQAETYYKKALDLEPRFSSALHGLGLLYSLRGDKNKAKELYQKALEIDPNSIDSVVGLLGLSKEKEELDALGRRLEEILANKPSSSAEVTICYALGDYYDKRNMPDKAFAYYKKANDIKKQGVRPYDPVLHAEFTTKTMRLYSPQVMKQRQPKASVSVKPVFVVGMMRSGTSLVEQILSSHPKVFGAGELEFWHQIFLNERGLLETEIPDGKRIKKLAKDYLEILEKHGHTAERIIDKSTFNINYAGLIHTVFPEAKIIALHRDPRDVCLSCYFKNFANGASFAMDLENLAQYYRQHERITRYWQSVLPKESFLIVPYEELVLNQEQWSRRLLEFIGLEWDESVLEFHQTNRVVRTASNWQVRQKMYTSSMGRWKAYQRYLGPVLELADLSGI